VEVQTPNGKVQGSGVVYKNDRSIIDTVSDKAVRDKLHERKLISYVVSNAHVVIDASRVFVIRGDRRYEADVKEVDRKSDLALLYVHGDLPSISPPYSAVQSRVGERVFAIGSPLGLENSISEGIISGKREENGALLLQTTASISPGSSGGGLFDEEGRFIGITTFKLKGGENINFAIDAGRISEIEDASTCSMFLRMSNAETNFSPNQLALIYSNALTEWFLERPRLCSDVRRRWSEDLYSLEVDEALEKAHREHQPIIARFFADHAGETAPTQNTPNIVILICSLSYVPGVSDLLPQYRGVRQDMSLRLDYADRTVNGLPATFTDTEVGWKWTNTKGDALHAVLNRYSGSIRIGTEKFTLQSGQCSPAEERKF
jgi:hypothetical protein